MLYNFIVGLNSQETLSFRRCPNTNNLEIQLRDCSGVKDFTSTHSLSPSELMLLKRKGMPEELIVDILNEMREKIREMQQAYNKTHTYNYHEDYI